MTWPGFPKGGGVHAQATANQINVRGDRRPLAADNYQFTGHQRSLSFIDAMLIAAGYSIWFNNRNNDRGVSQCFICDQCS